MSTNNFFKALDLSAFELRFFNGVSHKVEVVFDPNSTKWAAETQGWASVSYGNALVNLMLGTYIMPEPRAFLRKSIDEIKLSPAGDNYGLLMGDVVRKYIKAGLLSYRGELVDTELYRVAWDGWNVVYVRRVEYKDYDGDEADYVSHNRNAWHTVANLSRMLNYRDLGMNLRLVYTEQEKPYFEQALDLEKGEGGLSAKYGLFRAGKVDELRNLVNLQIANRGAAKTAYKTAKKIARAKEEAEAEGTADGVVGPQVPAEWKPTNAVTGLELDPQTLVGKSIQYVSSVGTLRTVYTVTADTDDLSKGMVSLQTALVTAKARGVKFYIVGDAAPVTATSAKKTGRKTGKARFTNDPQPVES